MIRKACVMKLKPGCEAEYKKRHDELWSEMVEMLRAHGGHNYSIFLHPQTLQLFAYVEIESEEKWQATASNETCQRWWKYMADIMDTNNDNSPVAEDLVDMFYLA
ncbi:MULTISPECIES: L-rhamnose mutarotase [Vibrio]|uniref:L-rhamnose mutarotase n=1 Tax=Vibrio casei TaxID=673372 RepID=A0A368LI44_9VIBR|nr:MULTISPECIES: L-rhamnose mutarotase [Vibrio]RCS70368.1 L-rhamnose mutarotase [Vibrio casei]SJN20348.1 L-rhamnose mutarotase [Vibrio casei]HBV77083.1 L-rhamnose mutarotase [Vibrio sp.]